MRTALIVTDCVAGLGLVLLFLAGPGIMQPIGVVVPIGMAVVGLVAGVVLRWLVPRARDGS